MRCELMAITWLCIAKCQVKSGVTRRWTKKYSTLPGYKERGKQVESPSQEEARSGVCRRSSSFIEPGWHKRARAQVWPRHRAFAVLPGLAVKHVCSAKSHTGVTRCLAQPPRGSTTTSSHQHPLIRAPCTTAPAQTSSLVSDHTRVSHAHARPLHPAALAFVPYGIVLVRVRVRLAARRSSLIAAFPTRRVGNILPAANLQNFW